MDEGYEWGRLSIGTIPKAIPSEIFNIFIWVSEKNQHGTYYLICFYPSRMLCKADTQKLKQIKISSAAPRHEPGHTTAVICILLKNCADQDESVNGKYQP